MLSELLKYLNILTTSKITTASELANSLDLKRPLVFTNGCFDILHRGHVDYLQRAKTLGESLVVGVNSDDSVRRQNKSPERPINSLEDRLAVLAALEAVDYVIAFDKDTPFELIKQLVPDILVKGGDWAVEDIVGNDVVWAAGGEVKSIPFKFERSTTNLIEKIRKLTNDCG